MAVENVAGVAAAAVARALADADVIVVDEIAPMQVTSDAFVESVRRALAAPSGHRSSSPRSSLRSDRALASGTPVVAAVHYGSSGGFAGEVERRDDAELFEVTPETHDDLPATLAGRVRAATA